jgi:N-acyl amino acid synthase of PEP-CTERM/exosortase system
MNALLAPPSPVVSRSSSPASPSAPYVRGGVLAAVRRLRYEVYCLERRFVDAALCAEGQESDEYDPHAVHFAATTPAGSVVATLRLVLDSPLGFPLEAHADGLIETRPGTERARTGEISRLIVAPDYRAGTIRQPLMLLGLFRHLYEECCRLGLGYLVAGMEGSLARLLRRLGILFLPLGASINYFGEVVPYGATVASMRRGYEDVLDYERTCLIGSASPFRYFRVSAGDLAR